MLDGKQNFDATEEDMIQIERTLRQFGPGSQGARDADRRYAAGLYQGEIVVFDHLFMPAKHLPLPETVRSHEDAEVISNFLNCRLHVLKGMDVSGLNDQFFISLGEVRAELRLAILLFLAYGRFGQDDSPPGGSPAI